ncbi:N-acetylglucosaminyl-phosphatidylinositol de-N-acetylase [Biomphalaria pfeifferi]|uniref:N-acetylglucosaminylphosphatidylinositol deacetylase n=1 Tax=Biomphalaria pfeifferi TaxID=112525 RepID=A0AAD8BI48_BIOPF|nr:N-acetylglucosaminyl-phosphatidylinositol de-N-acetylase [Biomphalaria pfeifferi]
MFFSPTVASLIWSENQRRASVYVICVTTGDYYKKGNVRRKELLDSCQVLGVLKENVEILDNSSFPDDPKASWNLDVLSDVLQGILNRIQANIIFTFDERGVSGHPNHIAVSNVVKQLFNHQTSCQVYQLESVSLVRKYIGLLDLPLTVSSNKLTFVSSPRNILRAQQAMLTHKSQLEWFRILYIIFSRYMFMNTYHSCN